MPGASTRDRAHASALPARLCLERWWHGCRTTELLDDLSRGGPFTLLAPVDEAFDHLPWSFDRLLGDEALLELRFDLFEHHVLRGNHDAAGAPTTLVSMHGERLRLGRGRVVGARQASGRRCEGRVLTTLATPGVLVHVIDACLLPRSMRVFVDVAEQGGTPSTNAGATPPQLCRLHG
jgi:hypothetical protein